MVVIVTIVVIVTVADVCCIHGRNGESVVAGGAVTGVLAGARIGPRTIPTCPLIVSSEANRVIGFDILDQVTGVEFDVNSGLQTEVIYEVIRFICRYSLRVQCVRIVVLSEVGKVSVHVDEQVNRFSSLGLIEFQFNPNTIIGWQGYRVPVLSVIAFTDGPSECCTLSKMSHIRSRGLEIASIITRATIIGSRAWWWNRWSQL